MDGSTDWTASEGAEPVDRRADPRAVMDWPRFVQAWAKAYDGYDLRHAGGLTRTWTRWAYKCGIFLTRRGASAAALTGTVVLAAVFVVVGVFADAVGRSASVLVGRGVRRDGFYRSLAERLGELCWLLAALLLGASSVVVLACLAMIAAHEYVRARATVSGLRPAGAATIGDRTLRITATLVFLGVAGLVGPLHADLAAGTTTLVVALWGLLALFGFVQLLSIIRKALVS